MSPYQYEQDNNHYATDDEGFKEDMAALARVCMIVAPDPENPQLAAGDTDSDSDSDDEWSDMGFVKRVQSLTATMTTTTISLTTDSDSDDYEDDFENARAIFKRFSNNIEGNPEGKSEMETLTKGNQEDIANSSLYSKSDAVSESCPVSQHPNTTNLVIGDIKTQHGDFVDSYEPDAGAESCPVPQNHDTTNSVTSSIEKKLSDFVDDRYEPDAGESSNLPQKRSSFPPAVHAFVDAIKKNRALQKFHRSKLIMLEAKIQKSKQIRDKVKILKGFQISCSRRTGSALSLNMDPRVQLILARKSPAPDNTKQNDASQGQVRKPEDAINLIGDDDDMILACLVRNKSKKNSQAAKGGS